MSAEFKETNRKNRKIKKPLENFKRLFCVQLINDNGSLGEQKKVGEILLD